MDLAERMIQKHPKWMCRESSEEKKTTKKEKKKEKKWLVIIQGTSKQVLQYPMIELFQKIIAANTIKDFFLIYTLFSNETINIQIINFRCLQEKDKF